MVTREGMHFSQSKNALLLNPSRVKRASEASEASRSERYKFWGVCRYSFDRNIKIFPLGVRGDSEMTIWGPQGLGG